LKRLAPLSEKGREFAPIMKPNRAAVLLLMVSFAAPVAAGQFEDSVDALRRGDYRTALRLIRPQANDGDAVAQYNLGLMYATGQGVSQDYVMAAIWLRKAAEQGYAFAQSNLGTLYRDGRGVPSDPAEAVAWFQKAADQGDPIAQYCLGLQWAAGEGVPRQDYTEAIKWFQMAAEQGHAIAKLHLGVMYAEGRGVPQNYIRAHMWFSLAAAQGEQKAIKLLDMTVQRMTPAQIAEAQKLARDWRPAPQPPPR
jgi:TPR repeat protein